MKRFVILALLLVLGAVCTEMVAQLEGTRIPPRVEDHFWRRKVINRIDLSEKINQPLVTVESSAMYANPAFGETQGVVVALINGLKSGKYLAYDPDSLNKSLTYDDVVNKAKQIEGSFAEEDEWGDDGGGFDDFEADGDFGDDEFGDFEDDFDFGDEDTGGGGDDLGAGAGGGDFAIAAYESVLEFIEDRIFDKNRSDMVYDFQYVRLVWVDPGETLPDKNFICLKYEDVLEIFENI
jgi:hypothetical protein